MTDPRSAVFHHTGCRSVTREDGSEGSSTTNFSRGSPVEILADKNESTKSGQYFHSTWTQRTPGLHDSPQETSANFKSHTGKLQGVDANDEEFMPHNEVGRLNEAVGGLDFLSQSIDTSVPDRELGLTQPTHSFEYTEIFEPEIDLTKNDVTSPALHLLECTKNPGHFAYFPINNLTLAQIPSKTRHRDVIKFFQLVANLTVRVTVTSKTEQKIGTGSLSLTESLGPETNTGQEAVTYTFGQAVRCVTSLVKRPKFVIHILTNKHVVSCNEEAVNTNVEFFYDHPNRSHVKVVKGAYVNLSEITDDDRATLVCKTSDHSFAHRIEQMRLDVLATANKLPRQARACMTKKVFIISHPHGKEKVLSYGDSVLVKYDSRSIEVKGRLVRRLMKVNNSQLADADVVHLRKALLYAADTCAGCCGAPVITFKRTQHQASVAPDLELEVFVHNGVEKTHGLGASVLQEYTSEDLEMSHPSLNGNEAVENDDEEESSGGQAEVTSPVFKVKSHPSYPSYIIYKERLNSFASWDAHHIHRPEALAHAGFFYAGYADCVRCFQCGLGLRSWKEGDNVYTQHEKHRPSCPFLQAHRRPTSDSVQSQATVSVDNDSDHRNLFLTALECEHEKLKQKIVCKVCDDTTVRDLFLPCGELVACTECSKLLTHCPVCHKQILATVATYFG